MDRDRVAILLLSLRMLASLALLFRPTPRGD